MFRKVYFDLIKTRISNKEFGWFFTRVIQYFLTQASFLLKKPLCGPILGTLVTNYTCNYRCVMCDLPLRDEEMKKKGLRELSTSQLKQVLKEFAGLGVSGVGFTGGEPLLRHDIFELLQLTKELGMISHLNTNGFLLDAAAAEKIIRAKTDSINISLDGATPKTHDSIRGCAGAFEKAIGAVARIREAKKSAPGNTRLKIVTVLNERNIDEVPDLIKLSGELAVDCIEFIPEQPFTRSKGAPDAKDRALFLSKAAEAARYLAGLKRKGHKIENSYRHLRLFERSFKNMKSPIACYAGYNSLTVDCYGEIFPCVPWMNWGRPVANIKDGTLKAVWYSKQYNEARLKIAKCRDCYLNCQSELNLLFN